MGAMRAQCAGQRQLTWRDGRRSCRPESAAGWSWTAQRGAPPPPHPPVDAAATARGDSMGKRGTMGPSFFLNRTRRRWTFEAERSTIVEYQHIVEL